jgi:methyl-accepting chemotaxis protein
MDIMNFGADTLELAKQDKDDPDLLQFHMETVKGLAFEAETAADRVKSVKDSAVEVKETAFKLLLQDISDLSVETEEQMAAFEELAKALEMVHETFEKAMMKKDEAMGLAESADKSIGQASENVDMAENCKEEINVYIEKIQMLIDGEDLPDDDDDTDGDDDNDDEDLLNDWLETFEPDFAKKCH